MSLSTQRRPTAHGLGITTEKPKFRHYAMKNKRYETYSELGWPTDCPVSVEDLVDAGLVYTGVGDSVRCFYCGGGIRNWEEGDRPIVEHARWYPNCPYVILLKGHRFVKQIASGDDPYAADVIGINSHIDVTHVESNLDDLVKCPAAQALIQNEYPEADVKQAIGIHRSRYGATSFAVADLYSILSDMEENPDKYKNSQIDIDGDTHAREVDADCASECDYEELSKENERLKELQLCKVCLENTADIIFLPCGHISCCAFCAPALEKCHICRKDINGQVKAIYASSNTYRNFEP